MKYLKKFTKHHFILGAILLLTFFFRLPSLFEPFWYGDEGIFAAVGRNLNLGGTLYGTAWDNKPPMIFLTYATIFKIFGVSMFWLRLVAIIFVLATAAAVYEIAQAVLGEKRALVATFIFGFLTSLRIIEGNLALTELFMILPITLAMLVAVKRKFDNVSLLAAGFLFAIGSLYKQVGALEAAALGIFLFLYTKSFVEFFKKGLVLSLGFAVPFAIGALYFAPKNLLDDWIFAAYLYYQIYFEESPQYAMFINLLKFLPIISAFVYGFYMKLKKKKVGVFHLFLLWTAFSFLGSYFSGRTYGHYLVQSVPALSLLIASVDIKPKLNKLKIGFAVFYFIPLIFLTKLLFTDFLTQSPLNQINYWGNFIEFARGDKTIDSYNNYFDGNVNNIMALADFLSRVNAKGEYVYIWGDYPWLYAISDLINPVRYVTSFHVFGTPTGREEVIDGINKNKPNYIIKGENSIGKFIDLENIIAFEYTLLAKIETSEVFIRKQ